LKQDLIAFPPLHVELPEPTRDRNAKNFALRRLPAINAPAQVEHRHPAGSQHERCELLRFTPATCPKSFQRRDQNLLRQVIGGVFDAQVAQTIELNARRQAAEEPRI
jgi:hypothetical protein